MLVNMKLVICYTSALDFIRAERWRKGSLHVANIRTLADCASSLRDVERIRIPAFDQTRKQLEVLVPSTAKACRSNDHICRVLKAPVIHGMFCGIAKNAYVVSPEMMFLQMATRLSFVELLKLG